MIWSAFKTYVLNFLPVEAQRLGIEQFREQSIRAGVIDIQSMIPAFRLGHTTTLADTDFIPDGVVSGTAPAPDGVVREVWFVPLASDADRPGSSNRVAYRSGQWADRGAMVLGLSTAMGQWALSPDQQTVLLAPIPDEFHQVEIVWDGIKRAFLDTDTTPFNEEVAEAVAEFVKGRITQHVEGDPQLAATHLQNYAKLRQRINSDIKEKENA